jgi:hypothetical protein
MFLSPTTFKNEAASPAQTKAENDLLETFKQRSSHLDTYVPIRIFASCLLLANPSLAASDNIENNKGQINAFTEPNSPQHMFTPLGAAKRRRRHDIDEENDHIGNVHTDGPLTR